MIVPFQKSKWLRSPVVLGTAALALLIFIGLNRIPHKNPQNDRLFAALWNEDHDGAMQALAKGADPNARGYVEPKIRGWLDDLTSYLRRLNPTRSFQWNVAVTPLMVAADTGDVNMVKALIERGADCDAMDDNRQTMLMWAIDGRNSEVVQLLLSHIHTVNVVDVRGRTALMGATKRQETEVVRILIAHGANVNSKNN